RSTARTCSATREACGSTSSGASSRASRSFIPGRTAWARAGSPGWMRPLSTPARCSCRSTRTGCRSTACTCSTRAGRSCAGRLDLAAHGDLMAAFPFPHEIAVAYDLRGDTLTLTTTLRATGDVPVPVSFGWHPYLRLPGVARAEWQVAMPVRRRAILDELQ